MLLFLFSLASATEDLAPQIRQRTNRINSTVLIATQDKDIYPLLEASFKKDPTLPAIPTMIPSVGDFNFELERLFGKHNLDCLLLFEYQEDRSIKLSEFGNCDSNDELHFRIEDFNDSWVVYDQGNNNVSVDSFARVCNDYTVQARLEQERRTMVRNKKILLYGSGILGLSSFFFLKNDSIGFTPSEEARFWSFGFVAGTASIFYFRD